MSCPSPLPAARDVGRIEAKKRRDKRTGRDFLMDKLRRSSFF
jgi:hypothetical protein